MRHRRLAASALAMVLAMGVAACGDDGDEGASASGDGGQEDLDLTMGSTQSTSSAYSFFVAHGRLASEADGDMEISVREANGGGENIQLVSDGAADFGVTADSEFSKAINEDGRPLLSLMNYLYSPEMIIVRDDSGVESLSDLEGRPFAPGFQQSAVAARVATQLDILGIEYQEEVGSTEDIIEAIKDDRVVGFGKSAAALDQLDASMLDIQSSTAIRPVGFTEEEIERIQAEDPTFRYDAIPAGTFPGQEEDVMTSAFYAVYFVNEDMDEETAYRLTKALWDSIDEAAESTNFPASQGRTPEESVSDAAQELAPLHPGAIRYYREIGVMQ